jgi:DNA-binding transcriptional LysR family regulator
MTRDVPSVERQGSVDYGSDLNWEVLRLFLLVGRAKSFRAASEATGQAHNTISRKIAELEKRIGRILMARSHEGIRLTPEGESLFVEAERMELVLFDIARSLGRGDSALAGTVVAAIADDLGTHWILPRLVDFQRSYPGICLALRASMEIADVMRMEAEVAIQLMRPTAQGALLKRLGRLHSIPFASRAYLDLHGTPGSQKELVKHKIVQLDNQSGRHSQLFVEASQVAEAVVLRTTTAGAHRAAVGHGLGIGLLPTYTALLDTNLIPIEIGIRHSFDIWLTCHPDARKIGRIGKTIDWLTSQFDNVQFPWFRDEFIAPDNLSDTLTKREFSRSRRV